MAVAEKVKILLAFRSGGVCAFEGCGKILARESAEGEDFHIGEVAHICGDRPRAPRHDPAMTETDRNSAANLIWLCPDHHTIIDKSESDWSVERLRAMKAGHE